jgi:hypothetical protein
MRRPVAILLGICLLGAIAVVVLAARSDRRQAFTLGVTPAVAVGGLTPGQQVCQGPIAIPDDSAQFDRVRVSVASAPAHVPPVDVTIEPTRGSAAIAHGRFTAESPGGATPRSHSVPVGHVDTREAFRVCLRNAGSAPVDIYGDADLASRTSTAAVDGKPVHADISVAFDRATPRSSLSLAGAIFARAALWRTGWTGAWLYVLLSVVVVLVVPALVAVALRAAVEQR